MVRAAVYDPPELGSLDSVSVLGIPYVRATEAKIGRRENR